MEVFSIGHCPMGYYIKLYDSISIDHSIAEKLTLSMEKYSELLKIFNANFDEECEEYFFKDYKDIKECVFYLNEKYGLILALINGG